MSPKPVYALLKRAGAESGFARAWAAAVEQGRARALDLGIARAIHGTARPVFYGGRQIAQVRDYDARMLLAAVRAVARREGASPAGLADEPW